MYLRIYAVLCLLVTTFSFTIFIDSLGLSTDQTLQPNTLYTLLANINGNSVPSGSVVILKFSNRFSITGSTLNSCQFSNTGTNPVTSTSCSPSFDAGTATYSITFLSIYASGTTAQAFLLISFRITNPYGGTGTTQTISLQIFNSGVELAVAQIVKAYVPSALSACTYVSDNDTTGANSTRTVSFLPSVQLISGSTLDITLPIWFGSTGSALDSLSCEAVQNSDSAFPPCVSATYQDSTTGVWYEVITVQNLVSSNKNLSSPISLRLTPIRNPWNLATFGPISYVLKVDSIISQTCDGITQTVTQMNSPRSITFSFDNNAPYTISRQYAGSALFFYVRQPIPQSSGRMRISFSTGANVVISSAYVAGNNSITSTAVITQDYVQGQFVRMLGLTITTPPSSRPFTLTFTSQTLISSVVYGIDTITRTYQCQTGVLSNPTLSTNSTSVNAITQYTLGFRTFNALISGSFISVVFPARVSAVVGSSCSSTNPSLTCTVTNSSFATITISGNIPALTTLSITFSQVTNPDQAITTGSFSVYTYYDSGLDSLVDTITSGLTMTSTTNPIIPATATVIPGSLITYQLTTYEFTATLPDPIPAAGSILVIFPPTITLDTVSLSASSFSNSGCSVTKSSNTVTISGCFSTIFTVSNISFTLSGIYNPPSLQPTSSFTLLTTGPLGNVNVINQSIVTMTTIRSGASLSVTPTNSTVNTMTTYTLSFSFQVPHLTGDYFLFEIPSSMEISSALSCSAASGLGSASCSLSNATTIRVVLGGTVLGNISVTIQSIRNYDVTSTPISFSAIFFNSNNFGMERTQTATVTSTVAFMGQIFFNNNDQIAINQKSNLTLTLTSPFTLGLSFQTNLTSITVSIPSNFDASSSSCVPSAGSCSRSGLIFTISPVGRSFSSLTILLHNVTLPSFSSSSSPFSIAFLYSGSKVAENNLLTLSVFCSSPCQRCSGTASSCRSCLPTPNTAIYLYNITNQCLSSCPNGTFNDNPSLTCMRCPVGCLLCSSLIRCSACISPYFLFNDTCGLSCPYGTFAANSTCFYCASPCSACSGSSGNCTACLPPLVFFGTCIAQCPNGTYNSTGTCVNCSPLCATCSDNVTCRSCSGSRFLHGIQCLTSCPNGTFQDLSNNNCSSCSSPCSTCSGNSSSCTGCLPPLVFSGSTCLSGCPNGTFDSLGICARCPTICLTCLNGSTCTSCTGSLFFNGVSCVSTCPGGTFADQSNNRCTACDPSCQTCNSSTASSCSSCPVGTVLFNGICGTSCPPNYFDVSRVCTTCPNCLNCTSVTTCVSCIPGFFLFNLACYDTCPPGSLKDISGCVACDPKCRTCQTSITTCTSCFGSQFLLNGQCVSSCPSGYISNIGKGICEISNLGNIVYFPFSIIFAIYLIVVLYGKFNYNKTQAAMALCGGIALICLVSWLFLVLYLPSDKVLLQNQRSIIVAIGAPSIVLSVVFGIIFVVWFRQKCASDNGFAEWVEHNNYNMITYRIMFVMSIVSFPCFRLLYCRFYQRNNFSCFFLDGARVLYVSKCLAVFVLLFCIMPIVVVSFYVITLKKQYDQTLISSIDTLIISLVYATLLLIEMGVQQDYFDGVLEDQPYLKRVKYDHLNNSMSSMRAKQPQRPRTGLDPRQREQYFRTKVLISKDLNKFGHLNTPMPEPICPPKRVKTLPANLEGLPAFDFNDDQALVINQDLFALEQEERKRRLEQEQRRRKEQEERLRKLREEQERRRRQMLQDMDEQEDIQFPDLAAIERMENKGNNNKKSPTQLLSKKTTDDRKIDEKALKKIQELAKKNGLDAEYMKQLFGVQRNHNPQKLKAIIDIHNHVDRDAVKQLFSKDNDPEILQVLFGKHSTMDPNKLRQIMNDPNAENMMKRMFDKQEGILAADLVKSLLDQKSKYSQEFIQKLMGGEQISGISDEKMRHLLKDNPDKAARQANLKALKKIGGDNLQNKQLLKNMLGQQTKLDQSNFARVVNDLPKHLIEELFGTKSPRNDVLIQKLLNNKKIDLKTLIPILQDPQLADLLAQALANGDEDTVNNLLNLFKNGQKLDPALLKQFLEDPVLREKLKGHSVDPAFLVAILKEGANTDMKLLSDTLKHMPQDQIRGLLQFDPTKNIDYQKIGKMFEHNESTDPALLAQLLNPQIATNIFSKTNSVRPQMLIKRIQTGNQFNPQEILKIYGEDKAGTLATGERKYNITDNNFKPSKDEDQDSLFSGKMIDQNTMSRTAGGMAGFLSPIHIGLHRNNKGKNGKNGADLQDISDEDASQYADEVGEQEQDDDEGEGGKGKRRRRRKPMKPIDDIRLPSQPIYLQRMWAPHELKKKNFIKKKKNRSASMQKMEAMDEDNDVFDIDF